MDELIAISAVIADRNYRIKVTKEDEEVVRKTLKTINEKIIEFKTQFAGKDMQDYVAMVLIWYATEQNEATTANVKNEHMSDRLEAIEKLIDSQLQGQA